MKTSHFYTVSFPIMLVLATLFVSCAGGPDHEIDSGSNQTEPESYKEIPLPVAELLRIYETAVRNRDPEMLGEVLAEDPLLQFRERSLNTTDIRGMDAISEFRLMFFEDFGPVENFRLGDIDNSEGNGHDHMALNFEHPESRGSEWLHFRKANGTWKIFIIEIHLFQDGDCVTNLYQLLTDYDRSGFLNSEEREELYNLTWAFYEGPHSVSNQVDAFFDADGNAFIDAQEMRRAAKIHFTIAPQFARSMFPGAEIHMPFDLNGDGDITEDEMERVADYMLGGADLPVDREYFVDMQAWTPYPDASYMPVPRDVSNILDELADGNGDGRIDEREQELIMTSLVPAHKPPVNHLEQAIDRNKDGEIHSDEIMLILQDSALGRGMTAAGTEPPYDILTSIDRMLDRNGNGLVEGEEIELAVLVFSGDTDLVRNVTPELRQELDLNGDGQVEIGEIEVARELFFLPRPVDRNREFDLELDVDGDGFIEPHELGISAGISDKGEIPPFDERISIMRHRTRGDVPENEAAASAAIPSTPEAGSEYYRKLGVIQDKKLAVVTLDVGTEKVDEETARGVIVFVENAFVNIGKVRVVDRGHIEEVFDEFEFQSTGIIDENTAVEIGKLSGADIIVIGSINRVGGLFYLNIKLIAVQTAEIIGSSIAQAEDASGFLEMANQAVYKLF